jgi:hypothetical protein
VTIVVDDTSAVWAAHAGNLLAVERYIYFPSSRRQFGLRGKALLEVNRRARPMAARMAPVSWGRVRVRAAGSWPLSAAERKLPRARLHAGLPRRGRPRGRCGRATRGRAPQGRVRRAGHAGSSARRAGARARGRV